MERSAKKSPPKDPGGHKWKGPLPKGWTDASRKKFWNTLTSAAPKHKVTECIKRMDGKVSNPGAFCASLADRSIPGWREEAAKERRKKKALDEVQKIATSLAQPLRTRFDYNEIPEAPSKEKPHSMIPGKDQLVLDEDDPQHREKLASPPPDLEVVRALDEQEGNDEDEEHEEPVHSKLPGTDTLPMEEDPKVAHERVASRWLRQFFR